MKDRYTVRSKQETGRTRTSELEMRVGKMRDPGKNRKAGGCVMRLKCVSGVINKSESHA